MMILLVKKGTIPIHLTYAILRKGKKRVCAYVYLGGIII